MVKIAIVMMLIRAMMAARCALTLPLAISTSSVTTGTRARLSAIGGASVQCEVG